MEGKGDVLDYLFIENKISLGGQREQNLFFKDKRIEKVSCGFGYVDIGVLMVRGNWIDR